MKRWLPIFALSRPVTVLMGFLALVVISAIAWTRIPLQMMPSGFEPGFLYVWVPYPDAAPQEVDEQIVRPVLEELSTVMGIESISSSASPGDAGFALNFHGSVDMGEAYSSVVDRMERALPLLPDDAEDYGVFKFDTDDTRFCGRVSYSESMSDPYYMMTRVVKPRLERIPGVARVDTWGVPQWVVQIDFERDKMYSHAGGFRVVAAKKCARTICRCQAVESPIRGPIATSARLHVSRTWRRLKIILSRTTSS